MTNLERTIRIHERQQGSHIVATLVAPGLSEVRMLGYARELARENGVERSLIQITPLNHEEGQYLLTITRVRRGCTNNAQTGCRGL